MLNRVKFFFKSHVQRDSFLWKRLVAIRGFLQIFERMKSKVAMLALPYIKIESINAFESKVYSQNGEDGILEAIFRKIGTSNRFGVEFGVEDGSECNTRYLRERQGWSCLLMDPGENNPPWIKREFITAENINDLFRKYNVPQEFDLLSIDVDGNDYWIWKALDSRFTPLVVVIEYNAAIPPTESKTIPYDAEFRWDGTDYFGASLLALEKLGRLKGYALVGCESQGVNAFFVRQELINGHFSMKEIRDIYRAPGYGHTPGVRGWPASPKKMVSI